MTERIGVVLLHRGDPGSPEEAQQWLKTAYADPLAYRLSFGSEAQKALAVPLAWWDGKALAQKLKDIGGRSPVVAKVTALATALELKLNAETQGTGAAQFRVLPGFRYNAPSAAEACREFQKDGIRRVVGLSLYPQQWCQVTEDRAPFKFEGLWWFVVRGSRASSLVQGPFVSKKQADEAWAPFEASRCPS